MACGPRPEPPQTRFLLSPHLTGSPQKEQKTACESLKACCSCWAWTPVPRWQPPWICRPAPHNKIYSPHTRSGRWIYASDCNCFEASGDLRNYEPDTLRYQALPSYGESYCHNIFGPPRCCISPAWNSKRRTAVLDWKPLWPVFHPPPPVGW